MAALASRDIQLPTFLMLFDRAIQFLGEPGSDFTLICPTTDRKIDYGSNEMKSQ